VKIGVNVVARPSRVRPVVEIDDDGILDDLLHGLSTDLVNARCQAVLNDLFKDSASTREPETSQATGKLISGRAWEWVGKTGNDREIPSSGDHTLTNRRRCVPRFRGSGAPSG
jgi:hypothetical protein